MTEEWLPSRPGLELLMTFPQGRRIIRLEEIDGRLFAVFEDGGHVDLTDVIQKKES